MADGVNFNANLPDLDNETLRDLLKAAQEATPWGGKLETLQAYQDHPMVSHISAKRMEEQSGTSILFHVQNIGSGGTRAVLPYQEDEVNITDSLLRGRAEWAEYATNWGISLEEATMCRGASQIVDMVQARRTDMMMQMADTIEADAWTLPPTSGTPRICGIPYTIVPITTGQTAGFNGGLPAGFTSVYGLSPTTYSRWKNYNDRWAAAASFAGVVTASDVTKITRMLRKLNFRSPVFVQNANDTPFADMRMYCGNDLTDGLEERARKNNDNLGNDVARFAGDTVIKNLPVQCVPYLDNDATYPLVAVNHAYYKFIVHSGWYLREKVQQSPKQHNVELTFVDFRGQFCCTNRQRVGGIISAVVA